MIFWRLLRQCGRRATVICLPFCHPGCLWELSLSTHAAKVLSLASELKPFSEGYNAAAWIKRSDLTDAFLVGSHDAKTSTVAAYLGRPIYYLECQCSGTFIVLNDKRQSFLSPAEFGRRLSEAFTVAGPQDTILIRSRPVQAEDLKSSAPNLSVTLPSVFHKFDCQ